MLKKLSAAILTMILTALPLSGLANAATMGANLITNPSMETATVATTPDGWADGSWGTNYTPTTPTSYVTTEGHTGAASIKTTIATYDAAAAEQGDAKWYFTPVAVTPGTSYEYTHWYKSDVDSEIDVQFAYAATGTAETFDNLLTVPASPSAWSQITVTFTAPAGASTVTVFQALNKVGSVQIDDADLHTYTPTPFTSGMVTLTFDDGWLDQFTNGRPVLNQYGVPSTYYLLTGTVNDPAYMTVANMQTLSTDPVGNEMASHTVHHCSLSGAATTTDDPVNCQVPLTTSQIDSELGAAQVQLKAWMPGISNVAVNFASPYGEYDANSLNEIQKYYRSHRSTETGFNTFDNFNRYNIKVQNILDTTTPAQVQAWVDQAIREKTWLVLVYHRVLATDPSTAEDYNVTPTDLATEVQYIKNSGIAVRTIDQALNDLSLQLPTGTIPTAGPTVPAGKVGDITGDGVVNSRDATVMFANWGKTGTGIVGDVTGDGTVDSRDATVMFANWSK